MRYLLIALVISLLAIAPNSFAAKKYKPCKPYDTNICVERKSIPKSFRSKLPTDVGQFFLTPLQRYELSSEFKVPPEDNDPGIPVPQILIPAGTETQTYCQIVGGQMKCTVLSAYKPCPSRFTFFDESGSPWTCDVDCDVRRPGGDADANGNCDCDIEYNTCTAGYN